MLAIAILLLAGAVVNAAVAWGCALWSENNLWFSETTLSAAKAWPAYLVDANWPPPYIAVRREGLGFGVSVIQITSEVPPDDHLKPWEEMSDFGQLVIYKYGWPLRGLQWESYGSRGPRAMALVRDAASEAGWRLGLECPSFVPIRRDGWLRRIPVTPILSGLVVNTLFYATLLWFLIPGPFALRRLRRFLRVRRGLCPKCAYPMGDSAVCTECGRELPQRVRALT